MLNMESEQEYFHRKFVQDCLSHYNLNYFADHRYPLLNLFTSLSLIGLCVMLLTKVSAINLHRYEALLVQPFQRFRCPFQFAIVH